jgi:hypothetical protein
MLKRITRFTASPWLPLSFTHVTSCRSLSHPAGEPWPCSKSPLTRLGAVFYRSWIAGSGPAASIGVRPANHRLGHALDARLSLEEASRPIVALRAEERPNSWPDRLEYEILRREAESVILGSPPAASSPPASTPTEKAADHPGAKPE